jgi:hypothetical protein
MGDPLSGLDDSRGMFKRYETPLRYLCLLTPVFDNNQLIKLVSEAMRRLRQLDRFYEEAWTFVHHAAAAEHAVRHPENHEASKALWEIIDAAGDAAEAFYLFWFRIYDITRILTREACGVDLPIPQPRNFAAVRNHLLVHPERYPGKALSWSVRVTSKDGRGVIIKNRRPEDEKIGTEDLGLGPNAVELQSHIKNWIIAFHTQLWPGTVARSRMPPATL